MAPMLETGYDGLPVSAALLGLGLVAADNVALAGVPHLFGKELGFRTIGALDQQGSERTIVRQHHLAHHAVGALARAEDVLEAALLKTLDGGGRDHAAVSDDAHPTNGKAMTQAVYRREKYADIRCVARHDFCADRPPLAVDHHAQDQLHQVGPMVFRVAPLPQRLPTCALEADGRGVHEHDGELAEQVAPAG